MKYLILTILFVAQTSFAITFKPKPARTAANAEPGIKLVYNLLDCVKPGNAEPKIHDCAKQFLSSTLKPSQVNLILSWLQQMSVIEHPSVCPAGETKFYPQEIINKTKVALCSSMDIEGRKKKIVFLLTEEKGTLRLFNINN